MPREGFEGVNVVLRQRTFAGIGTQTVTLWNKVQIHTLTVKSTSSPLNSYISFLFRHVLTTFCQSANVTRGGGKNLQLH
jgi:hypothetical protein